MFGVDDLILGGLAAGGSPKKIIWRSQSKRSFFFGSEARSAERASGASEWSAKRGAILLLVALSVSGCGVRYRGAEAGFAVGEDLALAPGGIGLPIPPSASAAKVDQRGLRLCPLFPLKLQAQCIVTML